MDDLITGGQAGGLLSAFNVPAAVETLPHRQFSGLDKNSEIDWSKAIETAMLTKTYSKDRKTCKVKFELPAVVTARTAFLYGDFTNWDAAPKRMRRNSGEGFSVTISLLSGHYYRFHYILDGSRWMNDPAADVTIPNVFGLEESIVKV